MFFVIGAPTSKLIDQFKSRLGGDVRLVICASLEGYLSKILGKVDVYKLPTNFRAHFSDYNEPITQGETCIQNDESFIRAQLDVSNTLNELISLANEHGVPTYFAIVDRKDRPTCITVQGDDVVATNINQRDLSDLPNVDFKLTEDVLNNIVLPSFQGKDLKSELERLTGGTRKDGTRWTGSFLADVLTVACACCIDDADTWTRYDVRSSEVLEDGTFSKSTTLRNVPYWCCSMKESSEGNMYSFKKSSLVKMKDVLNRMVNEATPIWNSCSVWHDSLLNDVDDLPAIELCKALTVDHSVETSCNWCTV